MSNPKNKKSILDLDISIGKVSLEQKIAFIKHLAVMLKSGLTISEALEIVYDQTGGKLKKIVGTIRLSVESGNSLSASLGKYPKVFSSIFVNTVYVGESSGTMDENLEGLSQYLKKDKELIDKIKGAMFYPIIVLILAGVLGLAMAFVVLPKITPLFEGLGIDLPVTTRALISFSSIIQEYGKELFAGIAAFVFLVLWLVKQKFSQPVTHYLILKTPIIKNIAINKNLTVFSSTLGTLLKSGLNIDEALRITKDTVNNYYFKKALSEAEMKARQGVKLSEILQRSGKLFPSLLINMTKIGENSGRLEETLFYLSEYFETEVNNTTKKLSTAIEPMLLIFIGLMVGGLALSIITPIYKLTGNVQR